MSSSCQEPEMTQRMASSAADAAGPGLAAASTLIADDEGRRAQSSSDNGDFCAVCGDRSSGKHYGQFTCEGCKSFFKRSVRRRLIYRCRGTRACRVDQVMRNHCQYCRLHKCLRVGMRRDAVQKSAEPVPSTPSQERSQAQAGLMQAQQLLFSIVTWTASLPQFCQLPAVDQSYLLGQCWSDLLQLTAAQSLTSSQQSAMLQTCLQASHQAVGQEEGASAALRVLLAGCAGALQSQTDRLRAMRLDAVEFSCLMAIALFNCDSPTASLANPDLAETCQETAQAALQRHLMAGCQQAGSSSPPTTRARFGRLLLRLPQLKRIPASLVERLLFPRFLVAKVTVEAALADWLRRCRLGSGLLEVASMATETR